MRGLVPKCYFVEERISLDVFCKCKEMEGYEEMKRMNIPDFIEHRSHHSLLGLADGYGQAVGFAFAFCYGRLAADCTIGIHDLDRFLGPGVLD